MIYGMCLCVHIIGRILCSIHTMINLPKRNSTHPLVYLCIVCMYDVPISCSSRTCKDGECGDLGGKFNGHVVELDLSERSV